MNVNKLVLVVLMACGASSMQASWNGQATGRSALTALALDAGFGLSALFPYASGIELVGRAGRLALKTAQGKDQPKPMTEREKWCDYGAKTALVLRAVVTGAALLEKNSTMFLRSNHGERTISALAGYGSMIAIFYVAELLCKSWAKPEVAGKSQAAQV